MTIRQNGGIMSKNRQLGGIYLKEKLVRNSSKRMRVGGNEGAKGMEILRIVFLLFIVACLACLAILIIFIDKAIAKKRKDYDLFGEHFCNDCECAFIRGWQREFEYCPYCGKKLTLHKEWFSNDEKSEDNPFPEF